MKFPFEVSADEARATPESYVDAVFSSLASEFLIMPKGDGFLDYPTFSSGYEALKHVSEGFTRFDSDATLNAALKKPVILIVLRAILGFTPPEWAYIAASRKGIEIPQGAARTLDRSIRSSPTKILNPGATTLSRVTALVETACDLIQEGCPTVKDGKLHRFDKADSAAGLSSVQQMANLGRPLCHAPLRAIPWTALRRTSRLRERAGWRWTRKRH